MYKYSNNRKQVINDLDLIISFFETTTDMELLLDNLREFYKELKERKKVAKKTVECKHIRTEPKGKSHRQCVYCGIVFKNPSKRVEPIEKIEVSKYFLQLNSHANKMKMTDYEYQNQLIEILSQTIGTFEYKLNQVISHITALEERE